LLADSVTQTESVLATLVNATVTICAFSHRISPLSIELKRSHSVLIRRLVPLVRAMPLRGTQSATSFLSIAIAPLSAPAPQGNLRSPYRRGVESPTRCRRVNGNRLL